MSRYENDDDTKASHPNSPRVCKNANAGTTNGNANATRCQMPTKCSQKSYETYDLHEAGRTQPWTLACHIAFAASIPALPHTRVVMFRSRIPQARANANVWSLQLLAGKKCCPSTTPQGHRSWRCLEMHCSTTGTSNLLIKITSHTNTYKIREKE